MGRLTAAAARAITKPGLHGDGATLYLKVSKTGTKSWIQRVVVDGRRRELGLGSFPTIPLGKARSLAVANRRAIADGRDPLAEKRAGSGPSHDAPAMAACVNNTCPWSGNPVQPDSLTTYGGKVVGFCSPGFRDLFEAAIRHFERSAMSTTRD